MLCLSRRTNESVMIGDDVEVSIVDIRGDKVRLGFSAPKSLAVHRKEVWQARRREAREAAAGGESSSILHPPSAPPSTRRREWTGEQFAAQAQAAARLALLGLTTGGELHKQWYLEQVLRALGIDPNHFAAATGERFEPGECPERDGAS